MLNHTLELKLNDIPIVSHSLYSENLLSLFLIHISDPAQQITITGASEYKEGDKICLECNASDGNPEIYQYNWIFVPKYGGGNVTYIGQTFVEEKVNYTSSGKYICRSTNYGGSNIKSKDVAIQCKHFFLIVLQHVLL